MASIENIKKRLASFVKVRSVDSTLTHLKHVFLFKNQDKICRSFSNNEIKIWMSSNPVIGACYPVIQLRINDTHNRIIIKSKMNQIGLAIAVLINFGVIWACLNMFILREGLSNDSLLQRLIGFVVFVGIFNFPIYMSYKGARDVLIKEIEDIVQPGKQLTKR